MKKLACLYLLCSGFCFSEEIAPFWRENAYPQCSTVDQQHMIVSMEAYDRCKCNRDSQILRVIMLVDIECYLETLRCNLSQYEIVMIKFKESDYPDYLTANVKNSVDQLKMDIMKLEELKNRLEMNK